MSNDEAANQAQQPQQPLLALPAPSDEQVRELKVGGEGVLLDEMGPVVVNLDGTLSHISNWPQLSPQEQATSFRLIAKRNKQRLEALRARGVGAEDNATGSGEGAKKAEL